MRRNATGMRTAAFRKRPAAGLGAGCLLIGGGAL